jgi:hypothetical protein
MRSSIVVGVLLAALVGSKALGETLAPSCSPVLVQAARSSGGKPSHLTGRVSFADGGKAKASILVVWAGRIPVVGLRPKDVGGWDREVGSDGRFDLELPKPEKDQAFMVWAAAEGYLVSCEVFVIPGGVELEFILVPKRNNPRN